MTFPFFSNPIRGYTESDCFLCLLRTFDGEDSRFTSPTESLGTKFHRPWPIVPIHLRSLRSTTFGPSSLTVRLWGLNSKHSRCVYHLRSLSQSWKSPRSEHKRFVLYGGAEKKRWNKTFYELGKLRRVRSDTNPSLLFVLGSKLSRNRESDFSTLTPDTGS